MEVRKQKQGDPWYEEIPLPICAIRCTGGSYVITIPKKAMKKYKLKKGSRVLPILLKRKRLFKGEFPNDEEWIKLTKKERLMFEGWLAINK